MAFVHLVVVKNFVAHRLDCVYAFLRCRQSGTLQAITDLWSRSQHALAVPHRQMSSRGS